MSNYIKSSIFLTIFLAFSFVAGGQVFELSPEGNKAEITGTSSIHDWEMEVTRFSSGFRVVRDGISVKNIENVTFTCKAADIKSDNSIMNKKTQEALRSGKFPEIKFTGSSVSGLVQEGNIIKGTLSGKLSMAGQMHDVTVPFTGTVSEGRITINSSAEMTFSEYGMEPPTAMLGTLKTGDKVKVIFNLVYNKK